MPRDHRDHRVRPLVVLVAVFALVLTACSTSVNGTGVTGLPPLAANSNLNVISDGHTSFDTLAKNALSDVMQFWQGAYPSISGGKSLPPLKGGIYSVDDKNISSADKQNACLSDDPESVTDNAFYCDVDDSIAYDRVGFIPSLVQKYGDYFVALLFGHEFGHAIQDRLGTIDKLPSIVKETQADCAAGAFTAWVLDFKSPHFRVSPADLDKVLVGYIQLRDPIANSPNDDMAHGDGFDRLSALSTGISKGVTTCFASDWANRQFTERPYSSADDAADNGNEPEDLVLNQDPPQADGSGGGGLEPDLNAFWKSAAESINKTWTDVKLTQAAHPPCMGANTTTEFGYCPDDNTVYYSKDIADKAYAFGDYALGTLIVYGWGLAVRHQLFDRSLDDGPALIAAGCYAGAYSATVNTDNPVRAIYELSPNDMDEATAAVLTMVGNSLAYGARGTTGLDRIQSFVNGYFGGLKVC